MFRFDNFVYFTSHLNSNPPLPSPPSGKSSQKAWKAFNDEILKGRNIHLSPIFSSMLAFAGYSMDDDFWTKCKQEDIEKAIRDTRSAGDEN